MSKKVRRPPLSTIASKLHSTGSTAGLARELSISRNLAAKWAALPEVGDLIAAMERDVEGEYRNRIKGLAATAMDTLEEVMLDTAQPGSARVSAAKVVLDRVLPRREELQVSGEPSLPVDPRTPEGRAALVSELRSLPADILAEAMARE